MRYHPEDLSRVFVTIDSKTYIEVRYADVRRPTISLWEQRHARRMLRSQAQRDVSEALIFRTIEEQRAIVSKAAGQAQAAKKRRRAAREDHEGRSIATLAIPADRALSGRGLQQTRGALRCRNLVNGPLMPRHWRT